MQSFSPSLWHFDKTYVTNTYILGILDTYTRTTFYTIYANYIRGEIWFSILFLSHHGKKVCVTWLIYFSWLLSRLDIEVSEIKSSRARRYSFAKRVRVQACKRERRAASAWPAWDTISPAKISHGVLGVAARIFPHISDLFAVRARSPGISTRPCVEETHHYRRPSIGRLVASLEVRRTALASVCTHLVIWIELPEKLLPASRETEETVTCEVEKIEQIFIFAWDKLK